MSDPGLIDRLTTVVLESNSGQIITGFIGCCAAVLLLTITSWVPTTWHLWLQWPLYILFLLSLCSIAVGVVTDIWRGKPR
jgi:hypothetical protein